MEKVFEYFSKIIQLLIWGPIIVCLIGRFIKKLASSKKEKEIRVKWGDGKFHVDYSGQVENLE